MTEEQEIRLVIDGVSPGDRFLQQDRREFKLGDGMMNELFNLARLAYSEPTGDTTIDHDQAVELVEHLRAPLRAPLLEMELTWSDAVITKPVTDALVAFGAKTKALIAGSDRPANKEGN